MKAFLPFLLLAFSFIARSEEIVIFPEFMLIRTDSAPDLKKNEAVFVIKLEGIEKEEQNSEVLYSVDNVASRTYLKDGSFEIKTTAGNHVLQVYFDGYFEMYSDTLHIEGQTRAYYSNYPMKALIPPSVDKPVIYLYPELPTEFEVTVAPKGTFTFTYPDYNEGWKGIAQPDGSLEIDGQNYRYLFWESRQENEALNPLKQEGFVLKSDEISEFMETTLDAIGFTSQEKADFITFWVPRMIQFDQIFLTIQQDAACDRFAELKVNPAPENLHRFYVSWGAYNGNHTPSPQNLSTMNRDGFTVIEWGGQELKVEQSKEL